MRTWGEDTAQLRHLGIGGAKFVWATDWADNLEEAPLEPFDWACLGGVVMLAFHFAGKAGRRPTEANRATFHDVCDELCLDCPPELKFSKEYKALLPHDHRRDMAHARFIHRGSRHQPHLDLDLMLRVAKKFPERLVKELSLDYDGEFPADQVDMIMKKLDQMCEDLHSVEAPASVATAFAAFDRDGDGSIAGNELMTVLQKLDKETWSAERVKQLFTAMDRNHDGRIDYTEFVDFIFSAGTPSRASCVDQATRDNAHECIARVAERQEEKEEEEVARKESVRKSISLRESATRLSKGKSTFLASADPGTSGYVYKVRERTGGEERPERQERPERKQHRAPSTSVVSFGLGVLPKRD